MNLKLLNRPTLISQAAVLFAYICLAKLGLLAATIHGSASPVWPATGFAISAVYILGQGSIVSILIGAFLANFFFTSAPLLAVCGISIGNTVEAAVGALILRRLLGPSKFFRANGFSVAAAALLAPMVSASVGVASLLLAGAASLGDLAAVWLTWWVGDALGGLFLIPVALYFHKRKLLSSKRTSWAQNFGAAARVVFQVSSVCVVLAGVFLIPGGSSYLFLLFPALLVTAKVAGRAGLWLSTGAIAVGCILLTSAGHGSFVGGTLNENLIHLQLFLAAVALTAMSLESVLDLESFKLPALAFAICWCITGSLFYSFDHSERKKDQAQFEETVGHLESSLTDRFRVYEDALRSGAALYEAAGDVGRDGWHRFATEQAIAERYPGIRGYGVIWRVEKARAKKFEEVMQKDFGHPLKIQALGARAGGVAPGSAASARDEHYAIRFIEPMKDNAMVLGVDVSGDPVRRAALELARDTRRSTMTESVALIQGKDKQRGFISYLPIYLSSRATDSRPTGFVGWVFASFLYDEFFEGVMGKALSQIDFYAFDGASPSADRLIYRSRLVGEIPETFEKLVSFQAGQKTFTFGWRRGAGYVSHHDTTVAWVGLAGAVLSILLVSVVISLQTVELKSRQIAERLNREKSEALAKLAALIDASPSAIVAADLSGTVTLWNSACEKIFGWSRAEALGQFLPFIPENKVARAHEMMAKITNSDTPVVMQSERYRKDGTVIQTETFGMRVLSASGEVIGLMGVINDVTDKIALANRMHQMNGELTDALEKARADQQKASEATRIKSQFLANMSHELRTPLNGILGMAELLADTDLKPEQKEYQDAILESGRALLTLVNDILDISKIEAGRIKIEEEEFVLRAVVEEALRPLDVLAQRKGLSLVTELSPESRALFVGDGFRIRQVLTNLVGNALKFTERGSVTVRAFKVGEVWRFEIIDTGIGISSEARETLFRPFSQADGSTTRKFGGTGLGLSICRQLIELMGGQINFESTTGQGSKFWFELPLVATLQQASLTLAPTSGIKGRSSVNESNQADFNGVRILVAEDNPINQKILNRQLTKNGFVVKMVANGDEALRAFEEGGDVGFDLVLMDCQMPIMDGYEATRQIRSRSLGHAAEIPIVAMTANAMEGDRERCLSAGMNDYISKPATEKVVLETLEKWLSSRSKERRTIV